VQKKFMSPDEKEDNTYLLDTESPAEMARLINQERLLTQAMGGSLTGIPASATFYHVLDLGCGPGGWVLDVAFSFPEMEVTGVDISKTMIEYANARARSQQLFNTSFGFMDITKPLDFADNSFDLVNARFLFAVLRREAWPSLIAECTRILRPGGILRVTEPIDIGVTTSPSYQRIMELWYQASWQAGYGFSADGKTLGVSHMLPTLLRQTGLHTLQFHAHVLEVSTGTDAWFDFYRNAEVGGQQARPFFVKMGVTTPTEIEALYQQAFIEMNAEDFCGMWHYLSVWGSK
jgi:ubiquinone/menaquinone biosynthesis C-methylase UbiE